MDAKIWLVLMKMYSFWILFFLFLRVGVIRESIELRIVGECEYKCGSMSEEMELCVECRSVVISVLCE